MWCAMVFFFQAEDGIRDLVRSRGLGDVYKRQLGRFFIELMRTDDANRILGLRVNTWMSAFIILVLSLIHI